MRCILLLFICAGVAFADPNLRRFPDDFILGAATAAYQVEGAWDADGKGESIWDYLVHNKPELILDGTNGDIAANSYYNYQRDVEMMRELGLNAYRLSISWPRILPSGFANEINQAGVNYYNNLLDEMLRYNITPMVTLYHWDLPQKLQLLGGWSNPLIVDWFSDYARVAFETFGDRVKYWITINEPREICVDGYGGVNKAPVLNYKGIAEYLCTKNLLMAHAKVWRMYDQEFRSEQKGRCGIVINVTAARPKTDSEADEVAAEIWRQGMWLLYAHPIFSETGDYPKEFKDLVATKSSSQGYPRSRLPDLSAEEIDFIRGTFDFFGMNHYSGVLVTMASVEYDVPSWDDDMGVEYGYNDYAIDSQSPWLKEVPWSILDALTTVSTRFNNPMIIVTENGWTSVPGLIDDDRIRYYRQSLNGVLDALDEGINVKGFMGWSLMDNMEWLEGFKPRWGFFEVDLEDPERTRTARKSAFFYKEVIKSRVVDPNYEPDTMDITINRGH